MTKTSTESKSQQLVYGLEADRQTKRRRQWGAEPFALRHLLPTAALAVVWVALWLGLIVWVLTTLIG